jgi:hypothetical protein
LTELPPLSEAARARLAELANRQLTADEWRAQAALPLTPDEIEHTLALVRWFRRRYPSAADRLSYVRRAYARWQRTALPPSQSGQ